MQITLLPFGRVIDIEPGENLLSALRRHNEPISYSCEDGRCGLCRCEIASMNQVASGDYLTSDTVADSSVLACQSVPSGDCLVTLPDPDDVLVISPQITSGQIVAIESLAERVLQISLHTKKPLRFVPGQHFELSFSSNLTRMYSAASLPIDPESTFHIQLHNGGRASEHVTQVLKVGDKVRLRGPLGTAYVRQQCSAPTLYVSNGTGFGPMISQLRSMIEVSVTKPLHVYAGFTMSEDAYGKEVLGAVAKDLKSLKHCQRVIGGGELSRGDRRGLLTDVLADDLSDLRGWRAYVFGSPHAVDATIRLLRRKGITPDRLHAEPFLYSNL